MTLSSALPANAAVLMNDTAFDSAQRHIPFQVKKLHTGANPVRAAVPAHEPTGRPSWQRSGKSCSVTADTTE